MPRPKGEPLFKWIAALVLSSVAGGNAFADPLNKPVEGPKLVCFKYSTFMLKEGERITDFSGSPEAMSITVNDAAHSFQIGESEIFAPPSGEKRLVWSNGGTAVYRVSGHSGRYAVFGRTSFSTGRDRLVVWLSGNALKGGKDDASVYGRLLVRDPATLKCDQTFTYSWGF